MFTQKDRIRFNKKWKLDKKTGCWIWIASKRGGKSSKNPRNANRVDYGGFWWAGKMHKANRIAYQMFVGSIPEGMFVCHSCDNGMCVNPKHLFLDTHAGNMQDMVQKIRQVRGNRVNNQFKFNELTEVDVRKIMRAYSKRNCTRAKFAKIVGISEARLKDIVYRRTWSWV